MVRDILRRGRELDRFLGEERREVFGEEEGTDGVDCEGFFYLVVLQLGGGFFRVKDAWNGEGEAEVVV